VTDSGLKPYVDALADLFYPQWCVSCGRRASDVLCRGCVAELPGIEGPLCGRCGAPTAFEAYGCSECRTRDFSFEAARSPLRYEGVGKEVVHALKYRGYTRVVEKVAAPLMGGAAFGRRFDAVVAVPLHRSRLAKRGFNQAELLARAVSGRIGAPYVGALRSTRRTRDQITLTAAGRRENVKGAYAAKGPVTGAVLLVDDVYTTGATSSECAGALLGAGAREVYALTLCRTV
jgi:ComF family protein